MFDPLDELEAAIDKVAAFEGVVDVERIARLCERVEFLRVRAGRRLRPVGCVGARQVPRAQPPACGRRAGSSRAPRTAPSGWPAGCRSCPKSVRRSRRVTSLAIMRGDQPGLVPRTGRHVGRDEADLVTLARLTGPGRLRSKVREMTDAFDGDGGAADERGPDAKNALTFGRDPRRAVRAARVVRSRKRRHHRHRPRRRNGHPPRNPRSADGAPTPPRRRSPPSPAGTSPRPTTAPNAAAANPT